MARILVIEDHEDVGTILKTILTIDGHEVDTAQDGAEGIRIAGKNAYNIVITDIYMPEKDGLDVIRFLRATYKKIGIIAITGGATKFGVDCIDDIALILGADRVLFKVLDYDLLRSTVNELVESYGFFVSTDDMIKC